MRDELHWELVDYSCPRCDRMILIVGHPTHAEVAAVPGIVQQSEDLVRKVDPIELLSQASPDGHTGGVPDSPRSTWSATFGGSSENRPAYGKRRPAAPVHD
jgi:hypothetical protein